MYRIYQCFLRLSPPVHLSDFICPKSNNHFKNKFFSLFFQILWSIFSWKWHFPSVPTHLSSRSAKKEAHQEEEEFRCHRKTISIDHVAPSQSCYYILKNDLTWIIVKTWENISLSLTFATFLARNSLYATRPSNPQRILVFAHRWRTPLRSASVKPS